MKVTSLKYQKRNPNRVSIYVDDEYRFSLHVDFLLKYDIYQDKEISEEQIEKASRDDIRNRIYDRAVGYLARGPRSEFQIKRYIQKTLYEKRGDWYDEKVQMDIDSIEEETVHRLQNNGYIDDERFVYAYARSVIDRKAVSKYYLMGLLMQKGIDKVLATTVVDELLSDELGEAREALNKKYKKDIIEKGDQKKIQFLQRKGFSWEIISKLVEE